MLTKGSFTLDEWDHLLRLLNIMNFSMSSCSHLLSNRTQSVVQENSKERSAVAKPRPMNLVSRNHRSAEKTPPQDSSALNSRENQQLDQSYVSPSGTKLTRNSNQDPTTHSQELRQDDTPSWGVVNMQTQPAPGNWSEVKTSNLTGLSYTSTVCRSPTIDTLKKSSRTCGKTLTPAEAASAIGSEALKTNILIWELFMSTTMKARHSSWTKLR